MDDSHAHDHERDRDHERDHDHDHEHGPSPDESPDDLKARARALQSLLVENGVIDTEAVDEVIRLFEEEVGPMYGSRVVARAWSDPAFEDRLLEDANEAVAEFDFDIGQQHLRVVKNTPTTHNVVVCTLCSCYPWSLLGLPPTWYKTPSYRSRVVREPRAVLSEFGLELGSDIDVSVWDSSSEIRYVVLPQRPTDADSLSESELATRVTRDAMIGVDRVTDE